MSIQDYSTLSTIKQEINSDDEDNKPQNSVEVQVLSYKDIKDEPNSDNEDYSHDQHIHNSPNDSKSTEILDQIVKIKDEDEFEFRIIELNGHIDDYSQLDSIVEFEDEQKTSFRIEDCNSYECLEFMDAEASQDADLSVSSRNLRSSQVSGSDGASGLTKQILNRAQLSVKLGKHGLISQNSDQRPQKLLKLNSQSDLKFDQNSSIFTIKQESSDEDLQQNQEFSLGSSTLSFLASSAEASSNQTSTNTMSSNLTLCSLISSNLTSKNQKVSPTSSTSNSISSNLTSKSPQISLKHFIPNFLQTQILQETSKTFHKSMKFSDICYQKFSNLSNVLQKLSLNEKLLSRILLKNPSNPQPQQITSKMQIISKSIRLDKSDLSELPGIVMETFRLKRHSINFEKKDGQVLNMFNIPYYVCTTCSTIFATQNVFFMHFKALHATVEKPFECWKCTTSFCTWKELLTHLKCHDENRLFNCKICFYPFKLRESYEKHMRTVHVDKVEKISCEICGRNFDNERDMLTHKNRHAGVGKIVHVGDVRSSHAVQRINSIKCIFCPAQFFKNENLEQHYKTHKSLERMKCRGCGKDVMVNPQYIIKNIKMREFKCIKCSAPTSNELNKTVSVEDGLIKIEKSCEQSTVGGDSIKAEEPKRVRTVNMSRENQNLSVKCYVCGIDVGSNIKLFWHMKGHLAKNEFKCSVCREDFKSRESMVEHCKAEHPTTAITKCKICNKEFHFVDMDTHMKTHLDTSSLVHAPKKIRLNLKGESDFV
ncbi:zinc finger protein 132-like [Chironomus tepperi]|uniref:zinc finger protein 132-like n=1 Tax=Chironomus tepperi TaxID=113505 RepID=UPI00391F0E32